MTKVALSIVVCALTCLFVMGSYPSRSGAVSRAPGFETADQSLLVEIKKEKSKDKVIPKTCGKKVNCEAGYVKLEKPNKYGSCCEAREGLPPAKAAEPEKCKFPGEVGTPPNCKCPDGTDFLGYKGCVKFTRRSLCENLTSPGLEPFSNKCKKQYSGLGSCATFSTEGAGDYRCCCYYKVFEK